MASRSHRKAARETAVDPPAGREDGTELVEVLPGRRLECRWIGPRPAQAPTVVFLHEGLGCASLWRDFPDSVARETGLGALVYSRLGYGASDPLVGPRSFRFMHQEALEVLPAVLRRFGIEDPFLFGHSDGASIALIYAGARLGPVRALALEAPHVFVEAVCVETIARIAAQYDATPLTERLARHHGANTESMFRSWTDVWLRPEFLDWNIEEYLSGIEAPVMVVQGRSDEYGTPAQVDAVVRQVRGTAESLLLPRCGHSPHKDHPRRVLEGVSGFLRRALRERRPGGEEDCP